MPIDVGEQAEQAMMRIVGVVSADPSPNSSFKGAARAAGDIFIISCAVPTPPDAAPALAFIPLFR
jgi:hypothetical protein